MKYFRFLAIAAALNSNLTFAGEPFKIEETDTKIRQKQDELYHFLKTEFAGRPASNEEEFASGWTQIFGSEQLAKQKVLAATALLEGNKKSVLAIARKSIERKSLSGTESLKSTYSEMSGTLNRTLQEVEARRQLLIAFLLVDYTEISRRKYGERTDDMSVQDLRSMATDRLVSEMFEALSDNNPEVNQSMTKVRDDIEAMSAMYKDLPAIQGHAVSAQEVLEKYNRALGKLARSKRAPLSLMTKIEWNDKNRGEMLDYILGDLDVGPDYQDFHELIKELKIEEYSPKFIEIKKFGNSEMVRSHLTREMRSTPIEKGRIESVIDYLKNLEFKEIPETNNRD